MALTACNDDDSIIDRTGGNNLQVEVSANFHSRAPIHGSTLPDNNPIGVTLTAKDGSSYDNQNYNNIPYSATTADGKQTWISQDKPVTLSVTEGVAMAYWPYNADAADMTAVPVETDTQTDYMYSGNVTGLTNATPKAAFQMKHAMTLIRVNVVRGTYTAEGAVTAVTAASEAFCTSGTMNVSTGALAGLAGAETPFLEEPADAAITTAGRVTEFLVLQDVTVDAASVTLGVTVDGRKYSTAIEVSEAYKQGYIYTYNLTLDNTALNVSAVAVTPWEEEISVETPEPVAEDDQYIVQVTIDSDNYTYIHNIGNFVGTIDWGDGTVTTHENKTSGISHFYTTAGKYIIICSGKASSLYNVNNNLYKDISKIIKIGGDMGITDMSRAFFSQTKLTEIPAGIFDGLTEVTSFSACFMSCTNLTGPIPAGLFDYNTKVRDFSDVVRRTKVSSIPAGLFDKCLEVTNFFGAFAESEIINIPNGLFKNNTKADNFSLAFYNCKKLKDIGDNTLLNTLNAQNAVNLSRMFEGCSALEGPIPEGLFDNCTKVTNFSGIFRDCNSLTGNIPTGLFDNCPEVTTFKGTFQGCSGLTGNIPEGLFDNNTKVTDFGSTFNWCAELAEIPAGLFDNCPDVTEFGGCFAYCKNISDIPEELFDYNTKVTSFHETFQGCSALTEIPAGLFDNNTKVTTFVGTFEGCSALTSIPPKLFDNCPEVNSFGTTMIGYGCFMNCIGLTGSIPAGLFDNNTKVTSFDYTFKGCSGLTSIPEGLFDKCTEVTSFVWTFFNCTSLTGGIPNTLFDNNRKVTNFKKTFYGVKLGLAESLYTIINVNGEDKKVHLYERSLYPDYFAAPTGKQCYWGDWSFSDVDAITAAGWN